jgi:uncharacterized protein
MGQDPAVAERLTWMTGAALAFALVYPAVFTWVYFVALARGADGKSATLLVPYIVGKVIQFGFPVFWVCVMERQRLRWSAPGLGGLVEGVGFGLVAAAAILALYYGVLRHTTVFAGTPAEVRAKVEGFHAATPLRYLALAAFISVLHSLAEEYYWRWFVFGRLQGVLPLAAAILVSSLGFMAHHVVVLSVYSPGRFLTAVVPFSLGVAVGGAVWAWLYHHTGSLAATWVSHVLVDAAIMVVGYDLLFVDG